MSSSNSIPPPPPSLPALPPLLAMADQARARGELDQALSGYKAVLMVAADGPMRADAYARIGELKRAQGKLAEAENSFEKALAANPEHPVALEGMASLAVASGALERGLALLCRLAERGGTPAVRVAAHVRVADLLATRANDPEGAARTLEKVSAIDTVPLGVLARLRDLYEAMGAWPDLDRTFARLVERYALEGDKESAWSTCRRIARLRTEIMKDRDGALEAWQGVLRCKPDDLEACERVADLRLDAGEIDAAYAVLSNLLLADPLRPSVYSTLLAIHTKRGDDDRAWLSAAAIEALGALDLDAELIVGQYRKETPVRPEAPLDAAGWSALAAEEELDPVVTAVIAAIGPAAVRARVVDLQAQKRLLVLDPQRRQPPTSTVSAVRSFVWASQVLAVPTPELFVLDEVPGGAAAIAAEVPTTALGPLVLKGITAKRLAYVAGRHLTYYRPEFYPLVFFPTVIELRSLLLAALSLGLPEFGASAPGEAVRLSMQIAKVISDEERAKVAGAVREFDARGGKADLGAWARAVELTASRAGLLLAGDLASALTHIESEDRAVGDVTGDLRRRDLISYSVSEPYASLRQRLGVSVRR